MTYRRFIRLIKTPVTLLILLAFVYFTAKWAIGAATAPVPPRPPEPCVVTKVGPALKPEHVVVRVFNATETNGLGHRVGRTLRADDFKVPLISNAPEMSDKTRIVGFDDKSPEVVLVRSYFPTAEFVADQRIDHTVDVVLGKDYKGLAEKPLASVPLKDGTACLPQIKITNTTE